MRNFLLPISMAIVANLCMLHAQNNSSDDWRYSIEPNMMLPHMSGKAGVGHLPIVEVDQSSGDFFSHLKYGGMLTFEASNDKWVINTDLIYASLAADVKKEPLVFNGHLKARQFNGEVAVLRKISPWLEAGVGGVVTSVKSGFDLTVMNPKTGQLVGLNRTKSQTWFDPMLVVRTMNAPDSKFLYMARGEMGGFGVGSDFSWQLQAHVGYRFSKLFYGLVGYRYMDIKYEKGHGKDYFLYDLNTFGPMIKLGIDLGTF